MSVRMIHRGYYFPSGVSSAGVASARRSLGSQKVRIFECEGFSAFDENTLDGKAEFSNPQIVSDWIGVGKNLVR
jgi:hypothetical protein